MACLPSPKHNECLVVQRQTLRDRPMTRERSRSGHGESQHCAAPERMLPKGDANHDKTCQGQFITKKDDRCNTGTSSLGSIFGHHAGEQVLWALPGTPQNPARVSLWPHLSCPWSLGNLLESWLTVPTIFWNWRNFTASLGASVGSCPSPRLHSRIPHHFSCGKPPRTTSNRSPDVLLKTRRRGRFGRVDMSGSYFCMSSPPEHVQYRLPDCP